MPAPSRPLIVRLCNMVGDTVLSVPAFRLLEEHGWQLHLYGKPWAASLLKGHGWPCTARPAEFSGAVAGLRQLRAHCEQLDPGFSGRPNMLVMPNSFSSVLEGRWAGLKPAGYARDGRGLLLARRERPTDDPHALQGFWQLARSFLGLPPAPPPARIGLVVPADAQAAADELLAARRIRPGFVCLVPFAAGVVDKQEKKWPDFPALGPLLNGLGRDLVACPGPGEAGELAGAGYEAVVALSELPLGVYLGVLQRASLVISNDTGPAHMAAGVGTRVLSVLGPTKPEQWRPWGPQVQVVQKPSGWPKPADVAAAARQLLSA